LIFRILIRGAMTDGVVFEPAVFVDLVRNWVGFPGIKVTGVIVEDGF
jgi:hypothetical protein